MQRIELWANGLKDRCSATELHIHELNYFRTTGLEPVVTCSQNKHVAITLRSDVFVIGLEPILHKK